MKPRALLLDAGGTLVPEQPTRQENDLLQRAESLHSMLPELSLADCRSLAARMADSAQKAEHDGIQHSDRMTAKLLDETRPGLGARAGCARHALGAVSWKLRPFPGTAEMLLEARRLGLRTVLVSNTAWYSEVDYWQRLQDMWLADLFDGLVSSFDVGVRKPHRAMFDAAILRAGCTAQECVMVGDSEVNDIGPAAALEMRTIRATMQYPIADSTAADAVAASPLELSRILRRLCTEEGE